MSAKERLYGGNRIALRCIRVTVALAGWPPLAVIGIVVRVWGKGSVPLLRGRCRIDLGVERTKDTDPFPFSYGQRR